MQLRKYQQEAVDEIWKSLRKNLDPVVSLPTGSGKSLVIAELCRKINDAGGRVLVLAHVQELISQNAAEFQQLTGIEPGILCAGLERSDKGHNVLFASVQSLYGPAKRGEIEPFNAILVDECHLVAEKTSDAKFYPAAFAAFPEARRVGLSATPFRMNGPVWGEDKYFSDLAYEVTVKQLVEENYLAPLVGVSTAIQLDLKGVKKTAGEYDVKDVELRQSLEWLQAVAESVITLAANRKHIAVFCPTVKVASDMAGIFTKLGKVAGVVVGDTEGRDDILESWKTGDFPVLCSVNILTTGFNFKALDCIVTIRPTESLSLWVQTLGRGTRTFEGKQNCLVLDYAGNLVRLGGICVGMDDMYQEGSGGTVDKVSAKPKAPTQKKIKTVKELTDLDPMFATSKGLDAEVLDVGYVVINSGAQKGKRLLMVHYDCITDGGVQFKASEFVCVEYDGWAYQQAVKWFHKRGETNIPYTADGARIKCYGLPVPRRVNVRKSGKYINVVGETF